MILRELQIDDLLFYKSSIIDLLIENYSISFDLYHTKVVDLSEKKFSELLKYVENKKATIIGAIKYKKIIGFIWIFEHYYFDTLRIHINQIAVSTEFRGLKIGSKLIEEIERIAKDKNINILDLSVTETNNNAIKFYNSIGFKTERRFMKKEM